MSLSCSCNDWNGEGIGWYPPDDFEQFMGTETFRRKRCISCRKVIEIGSPCVKFKRFKYPSSTIELKIYPDDYEISMADKFMCESCGEIFLNLDALGFCIDITEHMPDLLKEYHEITGFKKGVSHVHSQD